MKKKSLSIALLLFSNLSLACNISWQKMPFQTPQNEFKVRPQGLTVFKNNIILTNHYKDSKKLKTSDLMFLNKETLKIEKQFSFPEGYNHVGGIASDDNFLYAVDFDNPVLLKIDVAKSLLGNRLISEKFFKLPISGPSGLSIFQNLIAVSDYIVPHRGPYFQNRYLQFYDLMSGKRIIFEGDLKSSNYSQGLTFFESNGELFLAESINLFGSVLKYRLIGRDNLPDGIRIYSIDLKNKKIRFISEHLIPATMVEDLGFDGKYFYTTDEQDFHFYRGILNGDCDR